MGYIYRILNLVNNKQYIGQTKVDDPKKRWIQHIHTINKGRGCPILQRAVKKYGVEKFRFEVVIICFDDALDAMEKEYIQRYNTLLPNGYNATPGGKGNGFIGKKHSEETKQKLSDIHKEIAKTYSDELKKERYAKGLLVKQKNTEEYIKLHGKAKESPRKGIPLTEEQKQKRKEKAIENKKLGIRKRKILTPEELKTQNTKVHKHSAETIEKIREAARKRKGERIMSKEQKEKHCEIMSKVRGVKVQQFLKDGTFIKEYNTIKEAGENNQIPFTNICYAIRNNGTSGGFIWKRIEK